jgi:PST family polysaccharide transporter
MADSFENRRSVTEKGARGGGVVLLGSGASLVLQLVALVTLSRLLQPEDFGLVAMVAVFVTLGNLVRDFGLPLAGLQAAELSDQQASNLFWMNAAVAGVVAGVLAAITPVLVGLYGEPRLATIVPAMALVVFLGGLTAQLQVNLARRMRFLTLVISDVASQSVALALAIAMAMSGFGYLALVAQSVMGACLMLAIRWIASRWVPTRPRRGHGAASLLRTGSHYGIAQLLTFLQSNLDTVIIGAQFGATSLGYYNRAYQVLTTPASRFLDPLTQVVVATLNKVKVAGGDVESLLVRIQFGVGVIIVWVFAVTGAVAPTLLPFVLGGQWAPAVPIFQVLAIGGCVWVFNHVSYWVFVVNEKSRELLRYNLVSKPLAVLALLIGAQFGPVGVAWGYTAAMAFSWPLNLIWLRKTAGLDARRFAANGLRVLAAGAGGALAARGVYAMLSPSWPFVAMVVGVLAGTSAMLLVTFSLPSSRAMAMGWIRFVSSALVARKAVADAQN